MGGHPHILHIFKDIFVPSPCARLMAHRLPNMPAGTPNTPVAGHASSGDVLLAGYARFLLSL